MAVQSQDIASLFKELEDASKLAKLKERNNKKKKRTPYFRNWSTN